MASESVSRLSCVKTPRLSHHIKHNIHISRDTIKRIPYKVVISTESREPITAEQVGGTRKLEVRARVYRRRVKGICPVIV